MADVTCVSVYQYHDSLGQLLYVGVTARGIRRAHEHAETKEWWPLCTGCAIEHFVSRDDALAREADLIKRYKPPFNTIHNDRKAAALSEYRAKAPPPKVRTFSTRKPRRFQRTIGIGSEVMAGDHVDLVEARRRWYALSIEEKRIAPCIRCGERPGIRGPECALCKPSRSRTARR